MAKLLDEGLKFLRRNPSLGLWQQGGRKSRVRPRILVCVLLVIVVFVVASQQSLAKDLKANAEWRTNMIHLRANLLQLLPLALDEVKFNEIKTGAEVYRAVSQLDHLAKKVEKFHGADVSDPTVKELMPAFAQHVQETRAALELGKRELARTSILRSVDYCISCHTRSGLGPVYSSSDFKTAFKSISDPVQRIELMMAFREYDQASAAIEKLLKASSQSEGLFLPIEKLVHWGLQINLVAQPNLEKAKQILVEARKKPGLPFFQERNLSVWAEALESISAADIMSPKDAKSAESEKTVRARADRFLSTAQKLKEAKGLPRAGEPLALLALSNYNTLLAEIAKYSKQDQAQVFFNMAKASELSLNSDFSNLHEFYYRSCIQVQPKSELSKQCYENLEESTWLRFSSNRSVQLPKAVLSQLAALKQIAQPEKKKE